MARATAAASGGHAGLRFGWLALLALLIACDRGPARTIDLGAADALVQVVGERVVWDSVEAERPRPSPDAIELVEGFGDPGLEAGRGGVWVTATHARVRVRALDPAARRLEIALTPAPMPPGQAQTLAVRVAAGRPLTQAPLTLARGTQTVALDVPAGALPIGDGDLDLEWARVTRPADVDPRSQDARTLAARITRIALVRPTDAADLPTASEPRAEQHDGVWWLRAPIALRFPIAELGAGELTARVHRDDATDGSARLAVSVLRDDPPRRALLEDAPVPTQARELRARIPRGRDGLGAIEIRVTGDPAARVRLEAPRLVTRAGTVATPITSAPRAPSPPKRVVLVILDAASALHSSAYGYARPTTPFLEQLAARGVRFERAYGASSYTIASTAAILTGLYPERSGVVVRETKLGEAVPTLAGELRKRGARSVAIVGNPNASTGFGGLREFDEIHEVFRDKSTVMDPEIPRPRSMIPATLNERALEFLARDPAAPAFVYLHQVPPHHPYLAPPPYRGMFLGNADATTLIATWKSIAPRIRVALEGWELDFARDRYDENFRYADDGVAALVKALDDAQLGEDTLLVVTADHGEAFGEHGRIFHNTTVYEEMIRVPLVVVPPRTWAVAPHVVRTPVSTVDLFPTLVAFASGASARASPSAALDGIDLSAAILGGVEPPARPLTSRSIESWHRQALIDGTWKYIDDGRDHDGELYDLAVDPGETQNLVAERPIRALELSARLARTLGERKANAFTTGNVELDGAAKETLKALGYAGD
ncbi:MAG: sulfatase-like hydrolase/transferase [bacterium]